jgi:branched-chain amino acid transport system substrate-binding protein
MPGVHTPRVDAYRAFMSKLYPKLPNDDSFVYNYYIGAKALVQGVTKSGGAVGAKLQAALPRSIESPFQISNGGNVKLDSRNQAIQDQYQLQLVKNADGSVGPQVVAYVPGVDQSFGGLFTPSSPPPGRTQPACKKVSTPWQGKIKVVSGGKITNQILK